MRWTIALLLTAALMCSLSSAEAQTPETVTYYHTDAIGSVRMITDGAGQVVARYDFLPFGEAWDPAATPDVRQFAGKERDAEIGFDYFGARYYASQTGRFTTPDPHGIDPLRLVNPQRMNRYTYGMNNPFTYVDPDGRDAIVVNFSTGARISGHTFGHNGIISVHRDGSATFADFGPINQGVAESPGMVNTLTLPRLAFGADGLPTKTSFLEISATLAKASGQPAESIRLAYFKTSEADTAKLDAWVDYTYKKSRSRGGLTYNVFDQNCGHYCLTGLAIAQGRSAPPGGFSFPNFDFWILRWLADTTYQLKATVTTSETFCVVGQGDCR
jgi:RHS repeat-associated protein